MKLSLAAVTVIAGLVGSLDLAEANQPASNCGGFPLSFGTTIGWTGAPGKRQRVSSVVALASITLDDDYHARGWVVWDEVGQSWLGLTPNSPRALKALWPFAALPAFSGPGIQVRFASFHEPLPKGYRLTDCPHTLAYE